MIKKTFKIFIVLMFCLCAIFPFTKPLSITSFADDPNEIEREHPNDSPVVVINPTDELPDTDPENENANENENNNVVDEDVPLTNEENTTNNGKKGTIVWIVVGIGAGVIAGSTICVLLAKRKKHLKF